MKLLIVTFERCGGGIDPDGNVVAHVHRVSQSETGRRSTSLIIYGKQLHNMKKITAALAGSALALTLIGGVASAGNNAKSLGKTTLDTTVTASDENEMDYGDGISNGEWFTAEVQGVVIGLRATDRTDGLLDVTGGNGNRIGVYEASTGLDGTTTDRAEWNYEWSVDLSGAKGNAESRTISDYDLVLEQDYTTESLFGLLGSDPVQLPMPLVCDVDAVSTTLCQQSWNPTFGNSDFDVDAAATYNLRLVLTPSTFNGPPLAVAIKVNVTDPVAI